MIATTPVITMIVSTAKPIESTSRGEQICPPHFTSYEQTTSSASVFASAGPARPPLRSEEQQKRYQLGLHLSQDTVVPEGIIRPWSV
jgi:hypothetical protein